MVPNPIFIDSDDFFVKDDGIGIYECSCSCSARPTNSRLAAAIANTLCAVTSIVASGNKIVTLTATTTTTAASDVPKALPTSITVRKSI